jgi:hypothetical protein
MRRDHKGEGDGRSSNHHSFINSTGRDGERRIDKYWALNDIIHTGYLCTVANLSKH